MRWRQRCRLLFRATPPPSIPMQTHHQLLSTPRSPHSVTLPISKADTTKSPDLFPFYFLPLAFVPRAYTVIHICIDDFLLLYLLCHHNHFALLHAPIRSNHFPTRFTASNLPASVPRLPYPPPPRFFPYLSTPRVPSFTNLPHQPSTSLTSPSPASSHSSPTTALFSFSSNFTPHFAQ